MRIGIAGTQSTGKTTLLNALRSEKIFKDYAICDEVTRWVKSIGVNINENGSDITQELIMMKHIHNVFMYDDMLTDRTAIDGLVYSKWLYNKNKINTVTLENVKRVFYKLIGKYNYIFFIEPEFNIEDDGIRSTDVQFRDEINDIFIAVIKEKNIPVIKITGSVRQRVNQVLENINERN